MIRLIISALFLLLSLVHAVSEMEAYAQSTSLVKIDGSSTVFPISEAVAETFQKSTRGAVRVTVGISGTGGGFKKVCRGETEIQDASRPISGDELEECRKHGIQYFELPIAFDAMTVVTSPKNTWLQSIMLPELKRMWEPSGGIDAGLTDSAHGHHYDTRGHSHRAGQHSGGRVCPWCQQVANRA